MTEPKRLYRSRDQRMLGGVAGGIAEYFNVDPTIIRLIFVVLALPGFLPGVIPYLIMWVVVPEAPEGSAVGKSKDKDS